jgi:ECF sigma factor
VSRLPPKTVSELLANWQAGDDEALCAVVPLVYDEVRRLAHHCLRKERPDHTLQGTALEHETYLRLEKPERRFLGGLSFEETSRALNLSPRTVKRRWPAARLWLHHEMSKASDT